MGMVRKRVSKNGVVSWQIDYADPYGKRVRISYPKKRQAEAELGKRISLIAENRYLDIKKDYKTRFGELADAYGEFCKIDRPKSYLNAKGTYIGSFKTFFGEQTLLANIQYKDLEDYRSHLKLKPVGKGKERTPAAINREMSCLHHLFTKAKDWKKIERDPFSDGPSLIIKENNARLRFLNEEEITKLLDTCPLYLRQVVKCAILTGMRRGEILGLKWEQLRNGFVYLEKTKTNESRQIPVSDDLEQVFREIRREKHLTSEYVFTFRGEKMDNAKNSFKSACRRAGIVDFHFHDLRHTAASLLVQRGASLQEVGMILGHKSMAMTMRYAHLGQGQIKRAVNLLNGLTAPSSSVGGEVCHPDVTWAEKRKTETR
jgi:integrase